MTTTKRKRKRHGSTIVWGFTEDGIVSTEQNYRGLDIPQFFFRRSEARGYMQTAKQNWMPDTNKPNQKKPKFGIVMLLVSSAPYENKNSQRHTHYFHEQQ